jgi:hypothetical protein
MVKLGWSNRIASSRNVLFLSGFYKSRFNLLISVIYINEVPIFCILFAFYF